MNASATLLQPLPQGEGGPGAARAGQRRIKARADSPPPPPAGRFELTGRKVFLIFVLFFGTIASADAFLLFSAIRSWTGAETTSAGTAKAGVPANAMRDAARDRSTAAGCTALRSREWNCAHAHRRCR